MTSIYDKNKHLNYEQRQFIELGLNNNVSFTSIASSLNKHRTTIMREILNHRFKKMPSNFSYSKNLCIKRRDCGLFDCTTEKQCYEEDICPNLSGSPYVCNGCRKKTACRIAKYYYYSKFANEEYKNSFSESRMGINLSKDAVYEIDQLISPLIKENKQSINHIYANHPDILFFSKPTFYSYIDRGIFSVRAIDLPRKVKYRPRKNTQKQRTRMETAIRKERTYQHFLEYIGQNPDASIVEMDTVEGIKGGKVFLTLLFRTSKLMLIFLLENKTMICVEKEFVKLKKKLGTELFKKLFKVILTDNGSEFFNPVSIETDENTGEILSHVFYCDPAASWQKGSIEKNHEYIRYVLPKGSSFNNLTQDNVDILVSNINSCSRDSLNRNSPYNASLLMFDESTLFALNISKISSDDVNLSNNSLKLTNK